MSTVITTVLLAIARARCFLFPSYRAYLAARTREMQQVDALDVDFVASLSNDEIWARWPVAASAVIAIASGYRRARNEETR